MPTQKLDSIVLDQASTYSFLELANEEKLLIEEPNRTDYFLRSFYGKKPSHWVKQQILEQIVLTPKIYTIANLPTNGLSGHIFEEGILTKVEPPSLDTINIQSLSQKILSGMLTGRGYDIPENEFRSRVKEACDALEEAKEYEKNSGKKPPTLWLEEINKIIHGDFHRPYVSEYRKEEIEAEKKRQERYTRAEPIFSCIAEFNQIYAISNKYNAILGTPISNYSESEVVLPNISSLSFNREVVIIRIVADKLGKLSHRHTLLENLKLSKEEATIDLREQIPIWLNEIVLGNLSEVDYIQDKITKATEALSKLPNVNTVGKIATYIAVPISLLELLLNIPPILGITVGIVGKATTATNSVIENKYKWVRFGNT